CSFAKRQPGISPLPNHISRSVSSPPSAPAIRSARSPCSTSADFSTCLSPTGRACARVLTHCSPASPACYLNLKRSKSSRNASPPALSRPNRVPANQLPLRLRHPRWSPLSPRLQPLPPRQARSPPRLTSPPCYSPGPAPLASKPPDSRPWTGLESTLIRSSRLKPHGPWPEWRSTRRGRRPPDRAHGGPGQRDRHL